MNRLPTFDIGAIERATVITVRDDLDMASVPALEHSLATADAQTREDERLIVSLENCGYCDSSGLHALIRAWQRRERRFFVVLPPEGNCRKIFDVMDLSGLPFIVSNVRAALTAA